MVTGKENFVESRPLDAIDSGLCVYISIQFNLFMSESVQEEFRRIRENISKEIEVVSVNSKGELPPINGILTEFEPYISIDVLLSEIGKYTITCPFVGATGGINIIRDSNGQEIYRNDMLRFEKKLYNPFMNQEDNEYINGLKRAKFGNGHDIKMFDNE